MTLASVTSATLTPPAALIHARDHIKDGQIPAALAALASLPPSPEKDQAYIAAAWKVLEKNDTQEALHILTKIHPSTYQEVVEEMFQVAPFPECTLV